MHVRATDASLALFNIVVICSSPQTSVALQVRNRQDSTCWQAWKEGPPSGPGWQVGHSHTCL